MTNSTRMRPDYSWQPREPDGFHRCLARRSAPPAARDLDAEKLRAARNAILVIVDGLGDNYMLRRGAGGELARRRRASLTSAASTTASAITTSTRRTPLEHGLTGWFTYFGEAGCVSAALPFGSRGDHPRPRAARRQCGADLHCEMHLCAQGALGRRHVQGHHRFRVQRAPPAAPSASPTRRSTSLFRISKRP